MPTTTSIIITFIIHIHPLAFNLIGYLIWEVFSFFIDYLDSGDAVYVCSVCNAKVWQGEALRGNKDFKKTFYSICCYNGKVQLPNLIHPPQLLVDLYSGVSEKSQNFIQNVRRYNMMFAFTSMAGKVDHAINSGGAPYVYRMHGQNYHIAGSLLPEEGELPRFCQLYIYDTDHEVDNRFNAYEYVNNFYCITYISVIFYCTP